MQRFLAAVIGTTLIAGGAFAGQIQIGSGTNGANGLTSAFIGAGITGTFTEGNYDARLFQLATPAPTPYPGYQQSAGDGGATTTTGFLLGDGTYDNGVKFNMINDGTGTNGSNNFWQGSSAGATITVPIGLFGVDEVWTMLNNIFGPEGASDTVVTFNFGANNATTTTTSVVVNLVNAGNSSTPSGQIGTSVDCTVVTNPNCTNFAMGALAPQTVNIGGTGITVDTDTLIDPAYNSIASGTYSSSQGVLTLDDQGFVLPSTYAGDFLVSIQVEELNGSGTHSQTALSAVTVVTPEPSTVVLLFAGLGAIGVGRFRLRRR